MSWPFLATEGSGPVRARVCVCVCVRARARARVCVCVCVCVRVCVSRLGLCPSAPARDFAKAEQAGSPQQGQIVFDRVDTKATQAQSVPQGTSPFRCPVVQVGWLGRLGPACVSFARASSAPRSAWPGGGSGRSAPRQPRQRPVSTGNGPAVPAIAPSCRRRALLCCPCCRRGGLVPWAGPRARPVPRPRCPSGASASGFGRRARGRSHFSTAPRQAAPAPRLEPVRGLPLRLLGRAAHVRFARLLHCSIWHCH
jgi:hypothetical protein